MSKIYLGTELKLNVNIDPIGDNHMDNYDWKVELFTTPNKVVTVESTDNNNAIRQDADNYIIKVDTKSIGVGKLKCRVTAYIPDGDFSDYKRTEIQLYNPNIDIVRAD